MTGESDNVGAFVVLGASGGIGSCVAARLKRSGHAVLLASRGSDRLKLLSHQLGSPTAEVDATKLEEVEACFAAAVDTYGRLDGVVNCVGSVLLKPAHMTSESDWHETIATNLTSAFATVRAAAKTMRSSGGSVVLMSSAAARIGLARSRGDRSREGGHRRFSSVSSRPHTPRATFASMSSRPVSSRPS